MATARAPRRFCRCACFCTENLYVARYRLHVRFQGEQQLLRDYGRILRSRGCVSPKDFQELLGEVTFPSLHPSARSRPPSPVLPALGLPFPLPVPLTAAPGRESRKCQGFSAGEKRIYRLPVFTAPFCRALLEELEHFEQSDMPKGRPNTMNNYGVLLHELGLDEPLVTPLRERFLQPLMALLYPDCGGGWLDSHRAFVVKYALGQDRELGCHYDNAELTLNVALGKTFTGGALYFGGLFQVSVCNPRGRAWGSQECPGLSPAVCRRRQPWPGPWKWSMWWARASCTGAASCMGPGPWAQVSAGTSSSGFGPLLCATACAPCAAANPTWWTTTRALVMASPARSPLLWMCAC
ncbi:2-oxoglutarate and iron-dependent oxygenase domain-containing protein 2 isoform X3 [Vulpes lagopus]|uniref:2-oxoglutarate and iron-dependent oxygenase domain-containing protein 2 isoform X3 n=1 Tax=Vulpes lagopus TaxID=494514 RepID=UPI001BC8E0C3|nr:2-oxoglutarate and iron-dependent oxygenase domain-containing protein 2 isoform X3 [Vulpes lagopus]